MHVAPTRRPFHLPPCHLAVSFLPVSSSPLKCGSSVARLVGFGVISLYFCFPGTRKGLPWHLEFYNELLRKWYFPADLILSFHPLCLFLVWAQRIRGSDQSLRFHCRPHTGRWLKAAAPSVPKQRGRECGLRRSKFLGRLREHWKCHTPMIFEEIIERQLKSQ